MTNKKLEWWEVWWDRVRIYLLAILLMVLGAVALPLFEPRGILESKFWEHLAMGVTIAGVLAALIEVALHKRFADNVFRAAVGYLLREDLRGELAWIYEQTILCTELIATITLEPQGEYVKVRTKLQRTLKNISMRREKVSVQGGADEWFVEGRPTKLIEAIFKKTEEGIKTTMSSKPSQDGLGWGEKVEVSLAPNEQMEFTLVVEEWRQKSDEAVLTYVYPIKNPVVNIVRPDDIHVRVIFDHRLKRQDWKTSKDSWHLQAVLLPHQDIRIKWHPKAAVSKHCTDNNLAIPED